MYPEYPKDILAAQRNRSGMSGSQAKVGKALMWTGQHAHAVTVALKEIHEEVRRDMLQVRRSFVVSVFPVLNSVAF